MNTGDSISEGNTTTRLRRNGYVFVPKWHCNHSTIDIGRSIGTIVNIRALMPESGIPTVQTLRPRRRSDSSSNQYSGAYGLADFPLHTDLAHWAQPPRYLLLRCNSGSTAVVTKLLPNSALASTLGTATLRRALARPRRPSRSGKLCLLPLVFSRSGNSGFRWDPLFLIPMNEAAQRVSDVMSVNGWGETNLVMRALTCPGDTLIIDNWQFLHGRSSVPATDAGRQIERVYLSELHV